MEKASPEQPQVVVDSIKIARASDGSQNISVHEIHTEKYISFFGHSKKKGNKTLNLTSIPSFNANIRYL